MRACCFGVAILLAALTQGAQTPDPWLVVPGKSVGEITAKTTPAKLRLAFPETAIKDQMMSSGGDAEPVPATVINGEDPEAALTIFWDKVAETGAHPAATAHPTVVVLCYGSGTAPKTCKWHLANKISFGTPLRELEGLNGKEFQLSGFEWDFSGTVVNWKGGVLESELTGCGRILLRLEPRYGEAGPTVEQQKEEQQVSGDGYFPSSHLAMQELNPMVYSISMEFPNAGNCAGKKAVQ
jgi:hypothetical protein